ncbi:ABC-three component system middle component 4, partial [Vibrio cholerae]
MSKLPYIQPNKDKYYNLGIILILLNSLSRTKRGKLNITIERLQIFYFLVTRPVLMNQVLSLAGKKLKELEEVDVYSVSTISQNVDELFDKNKIRLLLK